MIEKEFIDLFVQVFIGGFAVGFFIGCSCFAINSIIKAFKLFTHI